MDQPKKFIRAMEIIEFEMIQIKEKEWFDSAHHRGKDR